MAAEKRVVLALRELEQAPGSRIVCFTGSTDSEGRQLMGLSQVVCIVPDRHDATKYRIFFMPADGIEFGDGRLAGYVDALLKRWPSSASFDRCEIRNGSDGPQAEQIQTGEYLCYRKDGLGRTLATPFPITHIFVCEAA
ncbi:MAG: hypothetical protein WC505_05425 [Patescibacteria group bacterium]